MDTYTADYFGRNSRGSRRSAREIVPAIIDLVYPASVIDVGCGTGGWLQAFMVHGVDRAVGVDGPWIDSSTLEFPVERLYIHDLTQPLAVSRTFDLVVSLEVAEHLPPECADDFVMSLVRLGPVVLFSAAVPHQGGDRHLNEQWPSYWAERFASHGYCAIDCLRKRFWTNPHVDWWYAQNMVLYVHREALAQYDSLRAAWDAAYPIPQSLVHPAKYLELMDVPMAVSEVLDVIPDAGPAVIVDEDFRSHLGTYLETYPLLERAGQFWGLPPDSETAIRDLERMRQSKAKWMVFGRQAFWWLDEYPGLREYLDLNAVKKFETEHCLIFGFSEAQPEWASPGE